MALKRPLRQGTANFPERIPSSEECVYITVAPNYWVTDEWRDGRKLFIVVDLGLSEIKL